MSLRAISIFLLASSSAWAEAEAEPPCAAYQSHFARAAKRFLAHITVLNADYLAAQAFAESSCRADALSPVGAQGLTQIMPATYREIAERVPQLKRGTALDPRLATIGQAFYMAQQYQFCQKRMGTTPLETRRFATASYNAGAGNICQKLFALSGARTWADAAPRLPEVTGRHATETTNYVKKIEGVYEKNLSRRDQLREHLAADVPAARPVSYPTTRSAPPPPAPPPEKEKSTFEELARSAFILNLGHTVVTLVLGLSGLWFAFWFVDKRILRDVDIQHEIARGNLATAKVVSTIFLLVGAFFCLALYLGFGA